MVANDVEQEPRYRPSNLPPANTRAELAVPLMFNQEVVGVLDVQSDQVNAFSSEDRFLFEALADTVAVALRNADALPLRTLAAPGCRQPARGGWPLIGRRRS